VANVQGESQRAGGKADFDAVIIGNLTVFQRTPNFCVPARNGSVDPQVTKARKVDYDGVWLTPTQSGSRADRPQVRAKSAVLITRSPLPVCPRNGHLQSRLACLKRAQQRKSYHAQRAFRGAGAAGIVPLYGNGSQSR
jgi:hypothetical protein